MSEANDNAAALRALALRIDELVVLSRRLADENSSLRNSQEALVSERANLLAKNEQARSRVEAMISRLRALEQNG
jgi:cell division protein ZapB